jgi:hypothetical protein
MCGLAARVAQSNGTTERACYFAALRGRLKLVAMVGFGSMLNQIANADC